MSEQLQTQMPDVDAEQAAHQAAFATNDRRATAGVNFNGELVSPDVPATPDAPVTPDAPQGPTGFNVVDNRRVNIDGTLTAAGEASAAATAEIEANGIDNSDRLSARVAAFMARKAGDKAESWASRRTTKQVAAEKYDASKEATKAVASKVGNAVVTAGSNTKNSVVNTKETVAYTKNAAMDVLKHKLAVRKEARANERATRNTEKFYADKEKTMLKDAYAENKAFDKNVRKQNRAEKRAEISEKAKKASKVIGRAAVVGTLGIAAAPAIVTVGAAYAGYKGAKYSGEKTINGAKKTIEVGGAVGNVINVQVRNGQKLVAEKSAAAKEAAKQKAEAAKTATKSKVADTQIRAYTGIRNKAAAIGDKANAKLVSPVNK